MQELNKIAVLIDGDNTMYLKLESLFDEIAKYGRIVLKRAYANWAKRGFENWKPYLERLAIKTEHQIDYVKGKNATDIALVIDAMKLLHQELYDGFVLVSSDSDFTPLAMELKESGVYVMVAGEDKASPSLKKACDKFISLSNLEYSTETPKSAEKKTAKNEDKAQKGAAVNADEKQSVTATDKETAADLKKSDKKSDKDSKVKKPKSSATDEGREEEIRYDIEEVHKLLRDAWREFPDEIEDDYADITVVGSYISRIRPDYDIKHYGFSKHTQVFKRYPELYEVITRLDKNGGKRVLYKCKNAD